ncbi:MAG: hypothetical protein AAF170_11985 [Bacteroidota bacterium]
MVRIVLASLLAVLFAFPSQAQRALPLPAQISGELTASTKRVPLTASDALRPADGYTFTLSSGQTATVRMESSAFDTYLKAFLNGDFHSRNDDYDGSRSVSQLTLSQPGTYEVLAGGFSGTANTGSYTLSVSATGSSPVSPAQESSTLQLPGTVQGQLSSSSERVVLTASDNVRRADRFTFTLSPGQRATVRMQSTAFDTYLKVLLNGAFHQRNDDYGGSRDVSFLELSQPGTYTLFAGAFSDSNNSGPYTLTTTLTGGTAPTPPPSPRPATQGDGGTQSGMLTDDDEEIPLLIAGNSRKVDAYTVELYEGEILVVTMESTAFDTYLAVAVSGEIVARNDDDGSTQRSRLRYTAPSDGQVYVYAGTFSEAGRGSYTFTWYVE